MDSRGKRSGWHMRGRWVMRWAAAMLSAQWLPLAQAMPTYDVIGQPDTASSIQATRCANADARFNYDPVGFEQFGPSGLAVDQGDRLFVTDFAGDRVLVFDRTQIGVCPVATAVIGVGQLNGPEALAWDPETGVLFVADTLNHAVKGFKEVNGSWVLQFTLGELTFDGQGERIGSADFDQFVFPRGLAVDPDGRLFVADDFNNRVLIFDPPFVNFESAVDSIGAGNNGGFNFVKAVAMVGHTLFAADHLNNRVLRFTGPFTTPAQTYTATGIFDGLNKPVDLAVHPDGSLLVTDQGNVRIARFGDAATAASTNTPASTFNDFLNFEPLGVVADRSGRVFVSDYRGFRVLVRNDSIQSTPVDPLADAGTAALLADLHARPARGTNRVAIGQQLITFLYGSRNDFNAWNREWLKLEQGGLPKPLMMGGDLTELACWPSCTGTPNQDAIDEMIAHGQAGGIVELVWHASNPVTGEGYQSGRLTTAQLQDVINDATATGQAWQAQINNAVGILQQLENAGVPVLLRPFHEQNAPFFWWSHNGATGSALRSRQAAFVAMWRDLVNELTVNKGLHNLLFVFGPLQVTFSGITAPMTYFPGGAWTDIVAIDIYDDELDMADTQRGLRHYMALTGTGKPFGIAEFGQRGNFPGGTTQDGQWDARTLTQRIVDSYPLTTFAKAWYSQVINGDDFVWALADVSFTQEMLAHPLIETLGDGALPDSDGDGMHDMYEITNGLDPNNPDDAATDNDGDGLSNLEEFNGGTDPSEPDTDFDGLSDGVDRDPIESFNACFEDPGGEFAVFGFIGAIDGQVTQCGSDLPVHVDPSLLISPGGKAEVFAPATRFLPGFSLPLGGMLGIVSQTAP